MTDHLATRTTTTAVASLESGSEQVQVQLTRIEGTINLVAQRMQDIVPRVEQHDSDIAHLKMTTQRLDLEAKARDETAIALAVALKDAKETQEATARQEAAKEAARDGKSWSPVQRLVLAGGVLSTAVVLYQSLIPGASR